jgi:hypothetical protein
VDDDGRRAVHDNFNFEGGGKMKLVNISKPEQVIEAGKSVGLFPLFTRQAMADRWGVSIQVLGNWAKRHGDFPAPINGLLASDPRGGFGGLYPANEVERYENVRGLNKGAK